MDELLRDFIAETSEHLEGLDRNLVAIEQTPADERLIGDAFRSVHSIKGACGFLGLKRLEALLHAAENLLGAIRNGVPATPATIGTLLGARDRAKAIIAALARDGHEPDGADGDIVARLELAARSAGSTPANAPLSLAAAEIATGPPLAPTNSIRVNLEAIDRLIAEASELVLARNQLIQSLRGRIDDEAAPALKRLSQVTAGLQESVMKMRMQPIGQAWAKLPRMVRDLGRELGKKIELQLEGAETELDRQVLELVKDPFTHLVRNAADHGIETPAERRRVGKPEAGTLVIVARQEGSAIEITVADDGRGVDPRLLRMAVRGAALASDEELAAMSERQLQQFVFHPGFTTAARVTSVSGRGIGLDVVRNNVEKIGGTVDLASALGRGARFTIRIPLTLAIMPALLLRCAGQRFAIPQTAIAELVRVGSEHRIEWIRDAPVLWLRGGLVPLAALQEILRLGVAERAAADCLVAVIGHGAQRFGVIIDGVDGAEEIVVKPLSPLLRGVKPFGGSAILGDGEVALILDPGMLAVAAGAGDSAEPQRATGMSDRLGIAIRGAAMLLFRAGPGAIKALPLAAVERIEEIDAGAIVPLDGKPAFAYRGVALPLYTFGATPDTRDKRCVVVATHEERRWGFLVDEILDASEEVPAPDAALARPGVRGVATVSGRLIEVLDLAPYAAAARSAA